MQIFLVRTCDRLFNACTRITYTYVTKSRNVIHFRLSNRSVQLSRARASVWTFERRMENGEGRLETAERVINEGDIPGRMSKGTKHIKRTYVKGKYWAVSSEQRTPDRTKRQSAERRVYLCGGRCGGGCGCRGGRERRKPPGREWRRERARISPRTPLYCQPYCRGSQFMPRWRPLTTFSNIYTTLFTLFSRSFRFRISCLALRFATTFHSMPFHFFKCLHFRSNE